jgi:hypothetical protein
MRCFNRAHLFRHGSAEESGLCELFIFDMSGLLRFTHRVFNKDACSFLAPPFLAVSQKGAAASGRLFVNQRF